ncbi:uncharacterized protein LOC129287856 [Prosopis cineraria]|uniref:uncharacterized protein LOC129287856 n=1 Tax=Prosopis cineraria TaxID=364024 RepID=UPI00240F0E67|nr:uncharacterized protein LOC129287856 [Prosopis cineraria]
MVSAILVLFLFISYAQAISTSESTALNHSSMQKEQEHFLERLSYGSMKDMEVLSDNVRKAHGSGGRGSPSGSGSANINRRPHPNRNSATSSLSQVSCFWDSSLSLSVAAFALMIFVFLFN